jgi:hypothetical protein
LPKTLKRLPIAFRCQSKYLNKHQGGGQKVGELFASPFSANLKEAEKSHSARHLTFFSTFLLCFFLAFIAVDCRSRLL